MEGNADVVLIGDSAGGAIVSLVAGLMVQCSSFDKNWCFKLLFESQRLLAC
jgi:hypothetical protein